MGSNKFPQRKQMACRSKTSLLKNTIALSAPNWANPFVSLLLVYVLSRRLGVEGVGQYAILSSYMSVFTTIASMGLGGLVVREISRKPSEVNAYAANSLLFGFLSSALAIIVMDCFLQFMNYDRELSLALIIGSASLFPACCSRFMESVFLAVERAEFIALGQFFDNLAKVILCIIFILLGYGIVAISTMTAVAKVFGFSLLVVFYFRVVGVLSTRFDSNVWGILLKGSPTFLGIAIFSSIYLNIDVIMLSKLGNVSSVGIYSAALKINQLCVIVPTAFSFAVLPSFSRSFVDGLESLRKNTQLSIHYLLVICIPLVVGIIVLADKLISLIYGQDFGSSAPVLRLMAPSLVLYSLVLVLSQVLIAANYQRVELCINFVAAILVVSLNFLLIPRYAEFGAALAGVLTVLCFVILQVMFVNRNMFPLCLIRPAIKPLLASSAMVIV
ncbi:MAG: flippase, partial [Desulfomonilaceae bacterium]